MRIYSDFFWEHEFFAQNEIPFRLYGYRKRNGNKTNDFANEKIAVNIPEHLNVLDF